VLKRPNDDGNVSTLPTVELGVLGPLQVRQDGAPVTIPGAKPRAILTMLGLHGLSVVAADVLVQLIWGDDPPRTAVKALQTHISSLRHTLGDGFVLTEGAGWRLSTTEIDASRYKLAAKLGRDAAAAGDTSQALGLFEEALGLWRGIPELPDGQRGTAEKTRWIEGHAALVEERADALLATGRAAEIIGDLEAAVSEAPLRERRWGQLMLALYRAGRQGEALGAYRRARSLLADELGVDPGPDLRRLEAAIVAQDAALETPVSQHILSITRAVTFLLTDIEGSTAAWEADADAMAVALARHDELVEQVVTSRGGRLIKTRGEGDATFSVFDRPSAAAAAAIELQEAISHEPWALREPIRIRVALHTGEVELRDGDYFGRAVNRAARLRSLAAGAQILCSGATAELVIDSLRDDVLLTDLGMRQLKNLARPEHVFELRLETADDGPKAPASEAPLERPGVPTVLAGHGPFVGRSRELDRLLSAWQTALAGGMHAVLLAGEPGVGKTRLAGEWSRHAYEQGAIVLYGRCDEDLGAPYQPFAEALRPLMPCLGSGRLRGLRGVESLLPLVPGLIDVLPDLSAPSRADADTERYALFDAVVALLGIASTSAPVVLILDDLHWAAKPTLLLLRHLLRFGEHARVQIVGTYRSTDLDRSHPLAAMLADLHRDGTANRIQLTGLDETDVSAYLAEAGYDDEELARALASVTGGNPFFLIEALRHVDESGGVWDPSTLPQGVREAVSRRLSRLPAETNKALAAAAVVGSRFALDLVERVIDQDLVDAFDEACKAGIIIEEPGGRYRFNHAIVRQSLLAELASVRRMRLHQSIATTLETEPGADDELLAELAYHYFECAWAGNAAKAVDYCRRAADQAMARLAYEGAADLYDKALHALEELDEELPDRDDQQAELLVARCEALLAAGDVVSATGAVSQLQQAAQDSARLAAWGTCFDSQLSMLTDPERLDEIESALGAAAEKLAGLDDAAGEAKAHTVRAACLARLGRIGDCETALDQALTAARRAREHRRVNAVLAGAPLAALWGPNPVPRAGGRCLDVVRLLRITTGSPVVEATSTRCQGVLDAFRGRAAAGRQLIDSARRSLTELGMRHALLEVDQFAGIVELVADDPASAEPHLRRAYNGFRRMGLDADTAETAALLARACLALGRDAEADELCTESERLAGHALKASIAWRTVRAQLRARGDAHHEARRVAEEAVALAERTDLLVDHGDACLALATVLGIVGDITGARAAAEQAVGLYERKGAAALAEKARRLLGAELTAAPAASDAPSVELDNACIRVTDRLAAAVDREAWDEVDQLVSSDVSVESRRKIVGFPRRIFSPRGWASEVMRFHQIGMARYRIVAVAIRGDRLALSRMEVGTSDKSPGAPQDELLQINGIDDEGRIAMQVWFDIDDMDAAVAELDAAHARFEGQHPRTPLENAASRADDRATALFADRHWDDLGALFADDFRVTDRRHGLRLNQLIDEADGAARGVYDRAAALAMVRATGDLGVEEATSDVAAIRGERLALVRAHYSGSDEQPDTFHNELLRIAEVDADGRIAAYIIFDPDDFGAAIAELDARYLTGEAAPYAGTWSVVAGAYASLNSRELPATTADWVIVDRRRGLTFASNDHDAVVSTSWEVTPDFNIRIDAVLQLTDIGAVVKHSARGTSPEGFDTEWREIVIVTVEGDLANRCEIFDETDLGAALARFDELSRPAPRLDNEASRVLERYLAHFARRDWDAMAAMVAEDFSGDDRRRVVNGGARCGRDAEIANVQAVAEIGCVDITSTPIATRGERLVLARHTFTVRDWPQELFDNEFVDVVEINAYEQVAVQIAFDADNIDAAFAELDARYLAGEAAPYARVWQSAMDTLGEANRHEPGPIIRGLTYVDHRRVSFGSGDFGRAVEELWALVPDARYRATAVHALDAHGTVASLVIEGTDSHGNKLEWSRVVSLVPDEPRMDVYEDDDVDAAVARFEELRPQERRLKNAATKVEERFQAYFAARDWAAMGEILADDISADDRRRVVNAGIRHGRDAKIADMRATADLGTKNGTSTVIAIRGQRLALVRIRLSGRDQRPDAFHTEMLGIAEINADQRMAACVLFDVDDIDAAFAELDARYIAGEGAAYARTWSVVAEAYAALNRRELPATTPDWVNIDHQQVTTVAPGDFIANIRASWDVAPDLRIYIEAVHRLSDLGALVTHAGNGTSQAGFDAEWRTISLYTVDGDLINRCELFDEADFDAAIARFEELQQQTSRLENAASQVCERFRASFAARDYRDVGRRPIQRGSQASREHRDPTRSRRRDGRLAGGRRDRRHVPDGGRGRDPWGAPRPHSWRRGQRQATRRVAVGCPTNSRDRRG
jgi:DNA-binding SARP family transcriptional activator